MHTTKILLFSICLLLIIQLISILPVNAINDTNYYGLNFYGGAIGWILGPSNRADCYNQVSQRFTAQATCTINTVYLYLTKNASSTFKYYISIYTDSGGLPKGSEIGWSSEQTLTTTGWQTISLSTSASLTVNNIYHIKILENSGWATIDTSGAYSKVIPLNAVYDNSYNTLTSTDYWGASWVIQNYDPLFVIQDTSNNKYGQPYRTNVKSVYGSYYLGETFTLSETLHIKGFQVYGKKYGTPTDLKLCLYNNTNSAWVQNISLTASEVSTSYGWITGGFTPSIYLTTGKQYTLYATTTGGNTSNKYQILYYYTESAFENLTYHGATDYLKIETTSYPLDDMSFMLIKNQGGSGFPSGGTGTDILYVDNFDATWSQWNLNSGSSPYLDAIDSSYVADNQASARVGTFTFADTSVSSSYITSVNVSIYTKQTDSDTPANERVTIALWDGTSWNSLGYVVPATTYGWIIKDATAILNTITKINGAKIYLNHSRIDNSGTVYVDCAKIDFSYEIRNWFTIETWYGTLQTANYYTVETWFGTLQCIAWNFVEAWITGHQFTINSIINPLGGFGFLALFLSIPILLFGLKKKHLELSIFGIVLLMTAFILLYIFTILTYEVWL